MAEAFDRGQVKANRAGELAVFKDGHLEDDSFAWGGGCWHDHIAIGVHNLGQARCLKGIEALEIKETLKLWELSTDSLHKIIASLETLLKFSQEAEALLIYKYIS